MEKIFENGLDGYEIRVDTDECVLIKGDSFKVMETMSEGSVDLIFADPPYFLSSDGITCKGGKMVSVNKGEWDTSMEVEEKHEFNRRWISLCYRVLKDSGTIWISGTLHNIYSVGLALEECGFKILNNITWQKSNPPPNLARKTFTHSTETILWAKKAASKKYTFNYEFAKTYNEGKQLKDVWTGSLTRKNEKIHGYHPTQKPLYLLDRIILTTSNENDIILDPFSGTSTTGVSALSYGRKYIGIESYEDYIEIAKRRLELIEKRF